MVHGICKKLFVFRVNKEVIKKSKLTEKSKRLIQQRAFQRVSVKDRKMGEEKKSQTGIKPDENAGTPEHCLRQLWQKPHLH